MVSTTITLVVDGEQFLVQNLIKVTGLQLSKPTVSSARATDTTVRHVNRKLQIPGATIQGYIKDIVSCFALYAKISEKDARKTANNTLTITVDGQVVYTKNCLVGMALNWLNISKNKIGVTLTIVCKDSV